MLRTADDIKKKFEEVKALAEKKPDNDFLKSVLEQMAEGHDLSSKQEEVLKEIEKEVKEMGEMKKEVADLKKAAQRLATRHASQSEKLLKSAEEDLVKAANKCDQLAAQLKRAGFHVGELKSVSKMCRNLIADLKGDSDIARDVSRMEAHRDMRASSKTAAPSSSFEALSAYWGREAKKLGRLLGGKVQTAPAGTYGVRAEVKGKGDSYFFNIFWRSGKLEVVGGMESHPGKYKKNFPLSTPTQDIFKSIEEYVKKWGK